MRAGVRKRCRNADQTVGRRALRECRPLQLDVRSRRPAEHGPELRSRHHHAHEPTDDPTVARLTKHRGEHARRAIVSQLALKSLEIRRIRARPRFAGTRQVNQTRVDIGDQRFRCEVIEHDAGRYAQAGHVLKTTAQLDYTHRAEAKLEQVLAWIDVLWGDVAQHGDYLLLYCTKDELAALLLRSLREPPHKRQVSDPVGLRQRADCLAGGGDRQSGATPALSVGDKPVALALKC